MKTSSTPEQNPFRRHQFVWLAPGELGDAQGDALHLLREWCTRERPVIIRRPCREEATGRVHVGLAMPPAPEKRRLGFVVASRSILERCDPPLWADCVEGATKEVRIALDPFRAALGEAGFALRTYGSYAWQALTGLIYVTPASDVDLIVHLETATEWLRFQEVMSLADPLPSSPRVDLEIVLGGDASLSWREYMRGDRQILCKGNRTVWLAERAALEGWTHA